MAINALDVPDCQATDPVPLMRQMDTYLDLLKQEGVRLEIVIDSAGADAVEPRGAAGVLREADRKQRRGDVRDELRDAMRGRR
jgi:hypothetical protein